MVLVKLADFIHILLQLRFIEPTGFIDERNNRFSFRFHLLAQSPVAEMRVPLETDLTHRPFCSLVNGENDPCSPMRLVDWIDPKLSADVGEAMCLINFDNFLARFLQLRFIYWLVQSQFDFFAQLLRFDAFSSIDYDFAHDRTRLHCHGYLDAVAFRLGEDANV